MRVTETEPGELDKKIFVQGSQLSRSTDASKVYSSPGTPLKVNRAEPFSGCAMGKKKSGFQPQRREGGLVADIRPMVSTPSWKTVRR